MATDPICGMFVEERPEALQLVREGRTYYFCSETCVQQFAQPDRALSRLRRRLLIAWPLTALILWLTYGPWPPTAAYLALLLATVVEFYVGVPFFRGAWDAIRTRVWNMDLLIAVGTLTAYLYSVVALAVPGRVPATEYFDASALIVTLILTGNYLEHLTRERARVSLRRLKEALPATAWVLREGTEREVPLEAVTADDRIRIRPGGRVPVDGVVLEGRSTVDESLLTGEPTPVPKGAGDAVVAGSINGEGRLDVAVRRVGADTVLARIGELVTQAETSRVPLQVLANRIASVFVPFVLFLAVVATVFWSVMGVGVSFAILVFVSVVITACPCAFAIATPAALLVGTGRAAEAGIVFKGGDSIERASRVNRVLLDKTGTVTLGRPSLAEVTAGSGFDRAALLAWAAAVEQGSDHPLARAVVEAAQRERVPPGVASEVRAVPGLGVRGRVAGHPVTVELGSPAGSAESEPLRAAIARCAENGWSWSRVTVDGDTVGVLAFTDSVRTEAAAAVASLKADGLPVGLVTGDRADVAYRVASPLGLSPVLAEVTPAGKLEAIRRLQTEGSRVAFVGDGINDAPALAAADLGIAVGTATAVAQETSGVILLRADLRGVALALRIGRATVRKVRTNLAWAIGYNAVLLPIAAGALVPWFGVRLFLYLPVVGALAMALSSTSVLVNSLSLRWATLSGPDPTGGPSASAGPSGTAGA